jgi:pyruvate kinase
MPYTDQAFVHTKLIATLGPATAEPRVIGRLIEEGVSVFRLNFSHGDERQQGDLLRAVRAAAAAAGRSVGVLGDLPGPKIRLIDVPDDGLSVEAGDRVVFPPPDDTAAVGRGQTPEHNGRTVLRCGYERFTQEVQVGHRVLIDDGLVRMLVVDKHDDALVCNVTQGGLILPRKGVNLPDTPLSVPSVTPRDWQWVDWAIENDLDFLALSFVRRADDIRELRAGLAQRLENHRIALMPVIAKIEKPEALDDLDAIIDAADAVMVARGDLGVEMDLAQVPVIQKRIIRLAHDHGKPVIVATQMLQSMIDAPTPTRAEVSDVANAIYDGADAVMLSGETAVGRFPTQTVHAMTRIARLTEHHLRADEPGQWGRPPRKLRETRYRTAALAHGVAVIVQDIGARLVINWTQRGGGARYLSQVRLPMPIVAASENPRVLRRMTLMFGVVPVGMPRPDSPEAFIRQIDAWIRAHGLAENGDPAVVVLGVPLEAAGRTNEIRLHYIGEADAPAHM